MASGLADTEEAALSQLENAIVTGAGLNKLKEMIAAQGGDSRVCDDLSLLPHVEATVPVLARKEGYLSHVNGTALGLAAQRMGAGRVKKEDVIDPAVGFVMEKRIGDHIRKGDVVATLHPRTEESAREAAESILAALSFSPVPVPRARLLYALITPRGVEPLDE